jgi:hypothetical protein
VFGWLETPFGLVNGFINHTQVVTTITYNTVTHLRNLQSLHSDLFILSPVVSAYSVSLNHTLQIKPSVHTLNFHKQTSCSPVLLVSVRLEDCQQLPTTTKCLGLSLSLMLRPTVSRSVCLGAKHPSGSYDQIFITCVTVTVLFLWGALSDERSGLSFVCAAGLCQRSLSRVRVPWDLKSYFTVSNLRLPFSSPPTTRRVTVEVFDPASIRVLLRSPLLSSR